MSPHVLHQTKLACDRIFFRRNATLKDTHLAGLLMHDDQEEITARKQLTFRLLRLQPIKNALMDINVKYSSRHLIGSRFIILDLQNVDDDPGHIIEERSFRESRTWLSACVLQLEFGDGGILRVDIRVRLLQIRSGTFQTLSPKGSFLTRSDAINFSPGRSDTSRWVGRVFLAAVLLAWLHITRMKTSPIRTGNTTIVMFLSLKLCWIPSPVSIRPSSQRFWISLVGCFKSSLGKNSLLLISCRAAYCAVETLQLWSMLDHSDLVSHLYCLFTSLSMLVLGFWTQLTPISVVFHVELVARMHGSRMPIKYVLVVKMNQIM
ncbi:uncharacterized protein ACBT44_011604 isoform 2-T2 [Syngnathus typhle]